MTNLRFEVWDWILGSRICHGGYEIECWGRFWVSNLSWGVWNRELRVILDLGFDIGGSKSSSGDRNRSQIWSRSSFWGHGSDIGGSKSGSGVEIGARSDLGGRFWVSNLSWGGWNRALRVILGLGSDIGPRNQDRGIEIGSKSSPDRDPGIENRGSRDPKSPILEPFRAQNEPISDPQFASSREPLTGTPIYWACSASGGTGPPGFGPQMGLDPPCVLKNTWGGRARHVWLALSSSISGIRSPPHIDSISLYVFVSWVSLIWENLSFWVSNLGKSIILGSGISFWRSNHGSEISFWRSNHGFGDPIFPD